MSHVFQALDLEDYLQDREEGENVRPASSYQNDVEEYFHGGGQTQGAYLPWDKMRGDVRLRPGEVSLWHGENYSGKSTLTSHVATDLMAQGHRVCIASMEMKPVSTLAKMNRQAIGVLQPSLDEIERFHTWTNGKLWIYDRRGTVQWDKMVAVIRYAFDKFQVDHFFVDSLMKCVRGEDDYNGQKDFVNALCTVAQDLGIHIHLIHHTKKLQRSTDAPSRYDAKGSGSISDQVDNVFGIWRNRDKDPQFPDCVVNMDKQRNGEWDGKFSLWYHANTMTFIQDQAGYAKRYA